MNVIVGTHPLEDICHYFCTNLATGQDVKSMDRGIYGALHKLPRIIDVEVPCN